MNYLPQSQYNVDLTGLSLMYAAFSTSATPNGVINAGNVMVSTSGLTMESNSSAVASTSATMGTHGFSPNTSGVYGSSTNGTVSPPISNKVFVCNLTPQTDATKLWNYFFQFGIVQDAVVMLDPQTQCSRKFGFVTFDDPAIVQKVLGFSQHFLEGQHVIVKPAAYGIGNAQRKNISPLSKWSNPKKVFLGGISQSTTKEDIEDYFSKSGFGRVQETYIPVDPFKKNRHRGFAFVTFESETTVDLICNTHFHTIKDATVESKRATRQRSLPTFVGLPAKHLCDVAQAQAGNPLMMTPTLTFPDLFTMGHHRQPRIIGNHRYMPYQHHSNAVDFANFNGWIQTANQPYETSLLPTPPLPLPPWMRSPDVACPPQFDWHWFYNALM